MTNLRITVIVLLLWPFVPAGAETPKAEVYRLNARAVELLEQGDYGEALATARRSVALAERQLGADHPGLAAALTNFGEINAQLGRFDQAEPPLVRAIGIARASWGIGPADLGKMLNNLGKLYANQARYAEAEDFYRQALALEKRIGRGHPVTATWRNNLANLYLGQGRHDLAWQTVERNFTDLPRDLDHDVVAETLSLVSVLKLAEGSSDDALRTMRLALDVRQRVHGEAHPATASTLHNLGKLLGRRGAHEEAEQKLLMALRIRQRQLPADHPDLGNTLFALASHHYALDQPEPAARYFERAFDNIALRFGQYFTFMSEADRLALLDAVAEGFPVFYGFCVRYHRQYPALAASMLDLLLLQKGMVAVSIRSLRARVATEGDADALRLLSELQQQRSLIANLRRQGQSGAELGRLEQAVQVLERELARRSAAFAERRRASRVRWTALRDVLAPGEAVVEYAAFRTHDGKGFTGGRSYAAIVLRAGDQRPTLVPLGDESRWHGAPWNDYRRRAGLSMAQGPAPSPGFHEVFWRPLEPLLAGHGRIYLVPDGALHQVAWSIIREPGGTPLIASRELRVLSSGRALVSPRRRSAERRAVLFGAPDFRTLRGSEEISPLPGTREEVQVVGGMLRDAGWQPETLHGEVASEARLKRVRRPRLLHIATHGFFESRPSTSAAAKWDPMLRSGLLLAASDESEDGFVTALEASTLDLHGTELVVLSACETGIGQLDFGEGVFGLRRAFEEAGAEGVMMSMWKVPDFETRELMSAFYRYWLAGFDKHQSLHRAQLEIRDLLKSSDVDDHPRLWGAFVLVGH